MNGNERSAVKSLKSSSHRRVPNQDALQHISVTENISTQKMNQPDTLTAISSSLVIAQPTATALLRPKARIVL